ncbi:MAG: hypothetical protein H0W67_04200 [Gemmatimonadales bacterium]|nr:hypothetical protein [Gemmatimonadales bacterium]
MSSRSKAALVLVLLTVAGLLAGVALDRFVLQRGHGDGGARRGPDLVRPVSPEQEVAMRRGFSRRLTRQLDLTRDQQARVDAILAGQAGEWRRLRADVRPRLERIFASFRDSMDTVLRPEQRVRFHQMRRERHRSD